MQRRTGWSIVADANYGGRHALSCWFGLSYASWLTIPRVLLEAMPDEWQGRLAELLYEYNEVFTNQPDSGTRVQITKSGRLVATPDWIKNYRHPDTDTIESMKGNKNE